MPTPDPGSQESFTPEQIAAWMAAAEHKRLGLHLLFAEPTLNRDQIFIRMSDLVKESLEEVRVLSATLQENSQVLRTHARQLREQSTALCERSTRAREQRGQDEPSAEAIPVAEQPMVDMFKDGLH
jgi:septal ring factor EnvC (AmiA/AmiB activator)